MAASVRARPFRARHATSLTARAPAPRAGLRPFRPVQIAESGELGVAEPYHIELSDEL